MEDSKSVSARFQRLVGELPPAEVYPPEALAQALPATAKDALDVLLRRNPTLYAAIENIEAAQYDINTRRAAYSPRLDFRARTENTENYLGARGDRDFNVAELVVNWNLFNGGSDKAREKQYTERKHLAIEMREKACLQESVCLGWQITAGTGQAPGTETCSDRYIPGKMCD